jgi:MYXO-CTERM domain-containing protein
VPQGCDPLQGAQPEKCDGTDNDCDGTADQGFGETTCGTGACYHTVQNCTAGVPATCDPLEGSTTETCDGADNDCDGATDEELGPVTCGEGVCLHTVETCVDGVPAACDPLAGASAEVCDGLDNDCNGQTDEPFGAGTACTVGEGACAAEGTVRCGQDGASFCDGTPGTPTDEACDGVDNDCDGSVDDLGQTTCGLGACEHTVDNCRDAAPMVCDPLEGAAAETCDGADNDCDGATDEGTCETCEPGTTVPCEVGGQAGVRLCGTDGKFGDCTPIVVEPVPETAEEADVVAAEDAWPLDTPPEAATPPDETITGDDVPAKPDAVGPDAAADVPAKPDVAQQDGAYGAEFPSFTGPGASSGGCTAGGSATPGALLALALLALGLVAARRRSTGL